jgi:biotin synthase-like enzyme
VEDFSRLGELDDPIAIQLSEAGVRVYGHRRDTAAEEERREEIYG